MNFRLLPAWLVLHDYNMHDIYSNRLRLLSMINQGGREREREREREMEASEQHVMLALGLD